MGRKRAQSVFGRGLGLAHSAADSAVDSAEDSVVAASSAVDSAVDSAEDSAVDSAASLSCGLGCELGLGGARFGLGLGPRGVEGAVFLRPARLERLPGSQA